MNTITIITVVVVALLTVVIFGLTWLAYSSCVKAYGGEVSRGEHDREIYDESSRRGGRGVVVRTVASCVLLAALLGLFAVGVAYKARGGNIEINGQTALVVKSGSMSRFHDDALEAEYRERNYDVTLQFSVGDLCLFEAMAPDAEPVEGGVYGYKYKDFIVTHRLVGEPERGLYRFRGDANPGADQFSVRREDIVYRYTGNRVPGIGAFVLFAQSYFGLWSAVGVTAIAVGSEVTNRRIRKINKERAYALREGLEVAEDENQIPDYVD